jgi:selenide,water dikinase
LKNICLCAGEKLDAPGGVVQLTKLVEKAGCASKIDQAFLKQVLKNLPPVKDKRVLVGFPAGDDAGVYDLSDGKALVQTVDVFTPTVDDPYTFGQIAAANSVSDIYAMGATPLTALSIIGFPARKLPDSVMSRILRGGIDKMNEARVAVIGGHSIDDDQLKAGFAVTGIIDRDKVVTNDAAKVGDLLILTKPLGTGIISFAAQIGRAGKSSLRSAAKSMSELNKLPAQLMLKFAAHACTDVTGFGLMGHLTEMARRSGVDVEINFDCLPLLPGVLKYAVAGIIPGTVERNRESCGKYVVNETNLSQDVIDICFDAQTSGGLLIAIESANAGKLLKALHSKGVRAATVIGRFAKKGSGRVYLKNS